MKLSKRAYQVPHSAIRNNSKSIADKIYHLNIGQPDLKAPDEFARGIIKHTHDAVIYTSAQGMEELRIAWSNYINQQYNTTLTADDFLITSGSSEALLVAFNTCCDVGDDILVLSPSYSNYLGFATITGVNLVPVRCSFDDNFKMPTVETIQKHITPKTRAILVCNPNNPTGTILTEQELTTLAKLCSENKLLLLLDEVYRELVYDDTKPITALSITQYEQNIVVFDSISKRFSLCGARVGCLISKNQEFVEKCTNIASVRVSTNILEQKATINMLNQISSTYVSEAVKEYETRRNILLKELKSIPNLITNVPKGGFYIFAKLPVKDSTDFCKFMENDFQYNNSTVALAPAHGFYINDTQILNNAVRIAFVLDSQDLIKAVEIIDKAIKEYKNLL